MSKVETYSLFITSKQQEDIGEGGKPARLKDIIY
jgi:hypothetical protein